MQEMLSSSIKVKKGNKLFPRNFEYNLIMLAKYVHFASIQPKNIQVKNLENLYNNKNFFELIKYSEVFLRNFLKVNLYIILSVFHILI